MPQFNPSADVPLDSAVQPCAEKGLVIVTYIYPNETPQGQQEAVADLEGKIHDANPATNRYEFLVDFSPEIEEYDDDEDDEEEEDDEEAEEQQEEQQEEEQQQPEVDERELNVNTSSQRWSLPHANDDYVAVVRANHTTYVTITLHACFRDRWFGVSEVFTSHRVYARGRDAENDYRDLLSQSLSVASQAVGNLAVTTVLPAAGFIRDDFNIIASFHQCSLLVNADEALHSRLLVHSGDFNREHVGVENVLPELPGSSQGGNVTISPPTPNYPYGAILVGIGRCWPNNLSSYAKAVLQPIVPVHAKRGDVEHTDEFVGFAGGPDNWKMVCASSNLALRLLSLLVEQRATLRTEQILPGCLVGVGDLANRVAFTRNQGKGSFLLEARHRFFQQQGAACLANRTFLIQKLGINENRTVDVPVLKHLLMPNGANFLPVNGGVVVPRQHSFRITADDATVIFEGMFDNLAIDVLIAQSAYVDFWADVEMTYPNLAGTHVDPGDEEALQQRAAAIAAANDAQVGDPIAAGSFVRIPCPVNTADLFDAYLYLLYRQLGIAMRFVPSAKLHSGGGNLHCATNYFPDFANLSFAQFPGDVQDVAALRGKLIDPATVTDLGAVEALKSELNETAQAAIAQFPDDDSDEDEEDEEDEEEEDEEDGNNDDEDSS